MEHYFLENIAFIVEQIILHCVYVIKTWTNK